LSGADQKIVWKESLISNVVKELWHEKSGESLIICWLIFRPPTLRRGRDLADPPGFWVLLVGTPHKASASINAGTLKLVQRLKLPLLVWLKNGSAPDSGGWFAELAARHSPPFARVPFDEQVARACDAVR
jgi:hypothetical protein